MCRMLVFYSYTSRVHLLREAIEAFINSSRYDKYLEKLSSGGIKSHDDGWGYVLLADDESIEYYKSLKPVFKDRHGVDKLVSRIEYAKHSIAGMIHSRKAGRKEPITIIDTHPFHVVSSDNGELWLVHNGGVDKKSIARIMNKEELIRRADSLVLTYFLGYIGVTRLKEAVKSVTSRVLSALNLGILVLTDNSPRLVVTSFYHYSPENDVSRYNYYKLYKYRDSDMVLYMSSTLLDQYGFLENKAELLPRNYYSEIAWDEEVRVEEHSIV